MGKKNVRKNKKSVGKSALRIQRQGINSHFDVLATMLGLEHSARIEKVSVLVEAIQEIKRITGKNRELRVNNEAMKFSLNGLVECLQQYAVVTGQFRRNMISTDSLSNFNLNIQHGQHSAELGDES